MVEVLIFLAGLATGAISMSLRAVWVRGVEQEKRNAADLAKRVRAQKTAEKRRTKAMKAAEQAQQAGNVVGANGATSWPAN